MHTINWKTMDKQAAQAKQVFEWIRGIIESCRDDFHFEAVDKLIQLYDAKYNGIFNITVAKYCDELENLRSTRWNAIHGILK